jgi:hypothetical protein
LVVARFGHLDEWHLQVRKPRGRRRIGLRGFPGDDGVGPFTGTEPTPKRHPHPGSFRRHATLLRHQFLQDGGLPFADVLTDDVLAGALATVGHWLDRIFSPLVTLWVFLGQVLSADHSCRAAVARLVGHRVARGQGSCSARTGAYCRARQRLPEAFFSAAACSAGRALDAEARPGWLWKGRRVYLFDGTTFTLPDTPENQAAYPQVYNQGPGLGFPIARVGVVISLACGAVVNLGFCRYAGKGEGEVSLLRRLWDALAPGDVLLGDRLMSGWVGMYLLKERGVDTVIRSSCGRPGPAYGTASRRPWSGWDGRWPSCGSHSNSAATRPSRRGSRGASGSPSFRCTPSTRNSRPVAYSHSP